MSPSPIHATLTDTASDILLAPYNRLSDDDLLEHFRTRTRPILFTIEDPEEAAPEKIAAIMEGRFTFIGETYRLLEGFDWTVNPSTDIEWHILLHKFYYAPGLGREFRQTGDTAYLRRWIALTDSWITQNVPAGYIASDVTGRRIQNWIYAWVHFVADRGSCALDPAFHRRFLDSLHCQVRYLRDHLHKARNHRTLELYAILLASVAFPEFAEATGWRNFAIKELASNARMDFRPDGGHREQSTHYHCIVLRNFLNVVRIAKLNGIALSESFLKVLRAALRFAAHLHRPDGEIPALSDADGGSYRTLLTDGAALLGCPDVLHQATAGAAGNAPLERCISFPDSGYSVLRSAWQMPDERFEDQRYLIFDCGPLGEGNHGHFDLMSIEAYAYGHPLIVDPGRYTYAEDGETNWRIVFRGTGAHSTVQIDGCNQVRYERGPRKFKIKGPPHEHRLCRFAMGDLADFVQGEARSYEYPARHQRQIIFVGRRYWLVLDTLDSPESHRYELRFQLSPEADERVQIEYEGIASIVRSPHLVMLSVGEPKPALSVDGGWVSRSYGHKAPAPVIRFSSHGTTAAFCTLLFPWKAEEPAFSLDWIESGLFRVRHMYSGEGFEDLIRIGKDSSFSVIRRDLDGRLITSQTESESTLASEGIV